MRICARFQGVLLALALGGCRPEASPAPPAIPATPDHAADTALPAAPASEAPDDTLAKLRMLIAEPRCTKSKTDRLLPRRPTLRRLSAEPRKMASRTLTVDAKRTMPNADLA